tara:strand:+ start:1727 stop:3700 length:1974 start_codon:yes stop_codon:yes gene_type:complete
MAQSTNRTKSLQVADLDFDRIKAQFKRFLQNQDQFRDYDFEGSGMSILLDILAYNTHYNGFYANMLASEMFLDSSVIRSNVVSRAKQLGYRPSSLKGATVEVNITLTDTTSAASGVTEITIPKGTRFSTMLGSRPFVFSTIENSIAYLTDPTGARQTYTADKVEIKEGLLFSEIYVSSGISTEKFTIPTANVDMSTLVVSVNGDRFNQLDNFSQVASSSNTFFTQEGQDGKYEFYFGDGNVGRKLNSSDIVQADYIASMAGEGGNGARTFVPAHAIANRTTIAVTLANSASSYAASGGAEREGIDSIKFRAPLNYEAQGRAVTVNDYRAQIINDVPGVDAVNVWGGEYNKPPEYGKVFISIKPSSGYSLSNMEKDRIKRIIQQKNLVTITPIIVEPEYIYVTINAQVMYDPQETSMIVSDIRSLVRGVIQNYSDVQLAKFNSYYRNSILTGLIDSSERSIRSNLTTVGLRKYLKPVLNTSLNYTVRFSNPIYHPHDGHMSILNSTSFSYLFDNDLYLDCSLTDSNGRVHVVQYGPDGGPIIVADVGTINYDSGIVGLINFRPITINDRSENISIKVKPRYSDILPAFNELVIIDSNDITATLVDDNQLTSTDRPVTTGSFTVSRGTYSVADTGESTPPISGGSSGNRSGSGGGSSGY